MSGLVSQVKNYTQAAYRLESACDLVTLTIKLKYR